MTNLSRRLPPLSTLVAFEAACRHGSFTRAADELALSQASISRRIRELEQNLGVELFVRRRHDVVPTADGETLASTAQTSLGELAATADRIRDRSAGLNRLTIFSDISLAQALVAPLIGEFQGLHPDLQIRVLSSSEAIDTVREHFDIGLQAGRLGEEKFTITPIGDDALFPVCSPEFANRLPTPIPPVEIARQPLLHFVDPGRTWPDWRTFFANYRLKLPKPNETLSFSSYQICLDVAEKGGGIALGWARAVNARLDEGRLVRIPGMVLPLPNHINVYRRRDATFNPVAACFIELLRKKLEVEV